jgi:hypothetical protein
MMPTTTTTTMNCIVLASGRRIPADDLIGSGSDGFVIRQETNPIKS